MNNFNYYTPTKVYFGKNTENNVGAIINEYGYKKVLIHYGGKSAIKSGLIDRVKAALEENNIEYFLLGGVVPNPRISLVYEGIKLVKENDIDFILAVGGGSVIDSSKAIGYGVYNGGDAWDFYSKKRSPKGCMPIGVILTIAAAGSEMSNSSVITNDDGALKRGCNTDYCRPKFAIMNPELTLTLPDYQTACGTADILMHTMERYFTNGKKMELTDSIAEGLMRTVINNGRILKDNPLDYNARAEIMWASSLSHNGLTGCGNTKDDFSTHKLEHELGGIYDVAHGAGLCAIWGSWARYCLDSCLDRFYKFAVNVMGIEENDNKREASLLGIKKMEEFYQYIGMPISIKELGIDPSDDILKEMAHKCALGAGGSNGSARLLYEEDMYFIYKNAL